MLKKKQEGKGNLMSKHRDYERYRKECEEVGREDYYDHLIEEYSDFPADHKFLQPTDEGEGFNKKILDRLYGLQGWKLSPQLHKLIGVL